MLSGTSLAVMKLLPYLQTKTYRYEKDNLNTFSSSKRIVR